MITKVCRYSHGIFAFSSFKVDLGEVRSVYSIATQGYRSSTYYTLSYKLQYSTEGNNFHDVIGGNGSAKVKYVHKVVH